jgi:uncharacterized spore protein YtfJ
MSENETRNPEYQDSVAAIDSSHDTMELFLSAADVHAVFSEPVVHGETMMIPAAEILSIAGFGSGYGSSSAAGSDTESPENNAGGGGGGGGKVFSRPVAVIVSDGKQVTVQPVFDFTKIALAGITAFGFMVATLSRMQRRRLKVDKVL